MPAKTNPASLSPKVFLSEVEHTLRAAARLIPNSKARERARLMKTVLPLLGLTVLQQRQILKSGYSFSNLPIKEQVPIWDYIWFHAVIHEAKMEAIFFMNSHAEAFATRQLWGLLRPWANDINCWDQADELSKRYSYLYEQEPDAIYATLQKWNKHTNPWKRRLSIVSLFCYAQLHDRHPPLSKVLPLVVNLLHDGEKYVQKGVGWTLRETYNVYPRRAFDFLLKHSGDIHPIAFSAAIEKMSIQEKNKIKKKRKIARN